jgi:DNA-binding beta-propeller fold protein YncE
LVSASAIRKTCWPGAGDGELNGPNDVAVDAEGNVYVADDVSHRVQKFDGSGNILTP